MTPDEPTSTKVRKNITVPEDLYREFLSLGSDGESQRDILNKLIATHGAHVELHEELVSLRARCDGYEAEVLALRAENDVLQDGIDEFGKLKSRTALVASGQTAIGDFGGEMVKDAMDVIKDVCDDETVCVKTALHLIDKKADVIGRQLDREHSREEKGKDRDHTRDEKEKDRKLKQDLETSRAEHQKNIALIKKGIVRKEDLEGVVFLGSMDRGKTAGERLAERKERAYHAANADDDDDFDDPEGEYPGEEEVDDDADHPEYEDHDHAC